MDEYRPLKTDRGVAAADGPVDTPEELERVLRRDPGDT
jgi:hypothetical protein